MILRNISQIGFRADVAALVTIAMAIVFYSGNVKAQSVLPAEVLTSPKDEVFLESDRLLMPVQGKECPYWSHLKREPDCLPTIPSAELRMRNHFVLFNDDGSVWFEFRFKKYLIKGAVRGIDPDRDDFKPLVKDDQFMVHTVILRLVAESKGWFEVEVNGETGETRFVPRSDTNWADSGWGNWMYKWPRIYLREENRKLFDSLEGAVIIEGDTLPEKVQIENVDGEWVYVRFTPDRAGTETIFGWIRWRKGKEILVGCIYNSYDGKDQQNPVRTQ